MWSFIAPPTLPLFPRIPSKSILLSSPCTLSSACCCLFSTPRSGKTHLGGSGFLDSCLPLITAVKSQDPQLPPSLLLTFSECQGIGSFFLTPSYRDICGGECAGSTPDHLLYMWGAPEAPCLVAPKTLESCCQSSVRAEQGSKVWEKSTSLALSQMMLLVLNHFLRQAKISKFCHVLLHPRTSRLHKAAFHWKARIIVSLDLY